MITGGTGSFGNYITHRLITEYNPKEIRIMSRDEKKQYDMRIHYKNHPKLKFFIGDIRDTARVEEVMQGALLVYQAAALKHVPVCESSPFEAVKTNIIGVENIIRASLYHKIERVVCISTDKAVKPVNVMGMTKAIQERLMLSANHATDNTGTLFSVVRYGNVLLSRGSVVPYFRKQLGEGLKITITDEKMTRFLLTLDDAIDLVIYATKHMTGGETFVKKAPSAYITDIAKVLCKERGVPFDYEIMGRLPGEKLNEILLTEEELPRAQDCGDYITIHPWWNADNFNQFTNEYSSGNEIVTDLDQIAALISRADKKMANVHLEKGEFSRI